MIRVPTVFVIGAGASKPYGFPLGSELRNLTVDPRPRWPKRERVFRRNDLLSVLEVVDPEEQYGRFSIALQSSGYTSVDQFLEKNPRYTAIGTIAIALALIPCERREKLFPPASPRSDHWYEVLVEMLDVGDPKYLRNRVTLVTYNYDRSLETYLSHVIRSRLEHHEHHARRDVLARHLKHVPILHLHGQLGALDARPYGWQMLPSDVQIAANGIKVIHAVNPQTAAFVAARKALREAKRIYFLGFGYNETNLARLKVFSREWSAARRKGCIVRELASTCPTGNGCAHARHFTEHADHSEVSPTNNGLSP
jgi:hypothetical protein